MLNPKYVRNQALIGVGLLALLVFGAPPALGICTQMAHTLSPSVLPPSHPCMCVPVSPWGYYPRQWQQWPGNQFRQDIVYPQSIGVQRVATPRGVLPKPLPRERYPKHPRRPVFKDDLESRSGVRIRQGASTEQIEAPRPFEDVPGYAPNLQDLDSEPLSPLPE